MDAQTLRQLFLDFFREHGHAVVGGAPLIPEHDPSVLFTTAGMHPLVPFLLGDAHPAGRRLADAQKCLRTVDILAVGDAVHLTFFEMLGNWSLGDYWKDAAIRLNYALLTERLGLEPERLHITCFAGDSTAPRNQDAAVRIIRQLQLGQRGRRDARYHAVLIDLRTFDQVVHALPGHRRDLRWLRHDERQQLMTSGDFREVDVRVKRLLFNLSNLVAG